MAAISGAGSAVRLYRTGLELMTSMAASGLLNIVMKAFGTPSNYIPH